MLDKKSPKKKTSKNESNLELTEAKLKVLDLTNRLSEAQTALFKLNEEIKKYRAPVPSNFVPPEPKDQKERAEYVGEIARLGTLLEPKIVEFIHRVHVLMEATGNSKEEDLILKGSVYAYREFISWLRLMQSEHAANIVDSNKKE